MLWLHVATYGQGGNIGELVKKGTELHDAGKYAEAASMYQQALAIDPNPSLAHYELSYTLTAMKSYEQAIEHANKVIVLHGREEEHAYMVRGNAQDLMGKPNDALVTYKAGLKKFPTSYLLNYNIALTCNSLKQYAEAENYAIEAIKTNEQHASSHVLLGTIAYMQGKRVQAQLAWCFFLLLEPDSKRSKDAFTLLKGSLLSGVTEKDDHSTISISGDKDEFTSIDLAVQLVVALNREKKKSIDDQFMNATSALFEIADEIKESEKHSSNIWWDMYIPFFYKLAKSNQSTTFCNYISQTETARSWVSAHPAEINKLKQWYKANTKQ